MIDVIVAQEDVEVKQEECGVEWCHESVFRYGLCFGHFVEEETARWDDQEAERETCLAGTGWR